MDFKKYYQYNKKRRNYPTNNNKRKDETIVETTHYSRCLLTSKIVLPITSIGKNLDDIIQSYISDTVEGKCVVEGFVKPSSSKVIRYSSGTIENGSNVSFEVVFECDVCFPVEGMILSCVIKNIVKSGIRAVSKTDDPSPFVVFVLNDHANGGLNQYSEKDEILVSVIGQRFELNDKMISVIGKIKKHNPAQYKNV
jgi:DNA-directed RNA polymerase subunit E'/Rpb7